MPALLQLPVTVNVTPFWVRVAPELIVRFPETVSVLLTVRVGVPVPAPRVSDLQAAFAFTVG